MKRAILMLAASLGAALAFGTAHAADAAAGAQKAKSCAMCHGPNGEGKAKNPPIAGMDQKRFVQAMQDYKSGKRANGMMKTAAAKLGDGDFADLAAHYATLKK